MRTKLNISWQCAAAAKKAKSILGCIRQNIVNKLKEATLATPGVLFVVLHTHKPPVQGSKKLDLGTSREIVK